LSSHPPRTSRTSSAAHTGADDTNTAPNKPTTSSNHTTNHEDLSGLDLSGQLFSG
jgi:hypothetical protein